MPSPPFMVAIPTCRPNWPANSCWKSANPNRTARILTRREHEILLLVAQGLSNLDIAATLHLAEKTIKHHMTALMRKLGVRNRVEAALYAQRNTLA